MVEEPDDFTGGLSEDWDGDDVLVGADEIAKFFYGDPERREWIYEDASEGLLPLFRYGSQLCARKSKLRLLMEEGCGSHPDAELSGD